MGGMSSKRNRRPTVALLCLALFVFLLILPVAYIFSAGPAVWLVNHGHLDVLAYFALYRPVIAFAYDHQTFNDVMNWYLSLWGGPIDLSP
jgi:hypothetical protein